MKRKILTLMVIVGGFALTSCQEDPTMDELIQDTELTTGSEALFNDETGNGSGSGGDGSSGSGSDAPGGN